MQENDTKTGFFQRLKEGLSKTRAALIGNIDQLFAGKKVIDHALLEEMEEILIMADVGPTFALELIEKVREKASRNELVNPAALKEILKDHIREILASCSSPLAIPRNGIFTILVVGVNGGGKTTTIGKIAYNLKDQGLSPVLVAADTFRAAAIEQLEVWSSRAGVHLVKQQAQADPSAVVFDALKSAAAIKADVMLIDTAGRLHTKINLMEEIKKVKRIMARELPGAPHEVLLVLDATSGQNAVAQAKMFQEEVGVTGLVLTKLDSTSKGGVIIRIARELQIPIRYIGVGEGLDDLKNFDSEDFVNALFKGDELVTSRSKANILDGFVKRS